MSPPSHLPSPYIVAARIYIVIYSFAYYLIIIIIITSGGAGAGEEENKIILGTG